MGPATVVILLQAFTTLFTYLILRGWSDRFLRYALVLSATPTAFYAFLATTGNPVARAVHGAFFASGITLIAVVFSAQLASEQ